MDYIYIINERFQSDEEVYLKFKKKYLSSI